MGPFNRHYHTAQLTAPRGGGHPNANGRSLPHCKTLPSLGGFDCNEGERYNVRLFGECSLPETDVVLFRGSRTIININIIIVMQNPSATGFFGKVESCMARISL